jgi:hypothetical protein
VELKDWLLPLLTLGAGVLTLFTDKDKRPSIKRLLLGGMIVTVAITIALNGTDTSKTHAQKTKDEKRIDDLIGIAKAANVNAANASNTANDILKRVKSWGLQPSEATNVVTSIKADEARKEALVDVKLESTPRPRVMYFPKDVDGPSPLGERAALAWVGDWRRGTPGGARHLRACAAEQEESDAGADQTQRSWFGR